MSKRVAGNDLKGPSLKRQCSDNEKVLLVSFFLFSFFFHCVMIQEAPFVTACCERSSFFEWACVHGLTFPDKESKERARRQAEAEVVEGLHQLRENQDLPMHLVTARLVHETAKAFLVERPDLEAITEDRGESEANPLIVAASQWDLDEKVPGEEEVKEARKSLEKESHGCWDRKGGVDDLLDWARNFNSPVSGLECAADLLERTLPALWAYCNNIPKTVTVRIFESLLRWYQERHRCSRLLALEALIPWVSCSLFSLNTQEDSLDDQETLVEGLVSSLLVESFLAMKRFTPAGRPISWRPDGPLAQGSRFLVALESLPVVFRPHTHGDTDVVDAFVGQWFLYSADRFFPSPHDKEDHELEAEGLRSTFLDRVRYVFNGMSSDHGASAPMILFA